MESSVQVGKAAVQVIAPAGAMAAIAPVLPPGFRFHPSDHELVDYYLKRKIQRLQMQLVIPEIDLCQFDPRRLPDMSFLAGRGEHQEWYFYSRRFPRYGKNGNRINRSTPSGYWKSTGKDRSVHGEQGATIGYKKTPAYLHGRALDGECADWAMHEYRLDDTQTQDSYGLYRLYKRKRTTLSPDKPSTAAADEENASRQVMSSGAAVGTEGAPMQVIASGAAAAAEGAPMQVIGSGGAPMQVIASAAAAAADGAPMQMIASAAAAATEGAPMQVIASAAAAAADGAPMQMIASGAAVAAEGAPMQVVASGAEGAARYTNALAEENNSWIEFTSDNAWYTNIDVDKDDSIMQFFFHDVWYPSTD